MMTTVRQLPTGTVTFLFTDIEGSTRLLEELGEDRYAEALAEHRHVVREACERHGGVEVDTQGDGFFVAFPTAPGGLEAAGEAQEALSIPVRMGIHTGTPRVTEEGYVGADVHKAARIAAAGHGGQVLVSSATAALTNGEGLRDLGEHRLKDLSAPERIFQLGDGDFPRLKTLHQTNLPVPMTPFLGRERELVEIAALVEQDELRVLTLSGPGGTGKTRLALQAAGAATDHYPDGVFWVPLAPIRDASLVLEQVGQAVGSRNGLVEHLGAKRLLLLLDNFEQVVDAAPGLGELLGACPNLKVMVTSRELLRIAGEVEYPVPPLAEPEAVEFFCTRAQLEPDETIAELCRRLDNLPLALELASARVRVLSPQQLLERLSAQLDLLKGGRDADPRQQTLRATIEWSHDLLDEEEQRLFARLSVFRGGCTLEAAEQVADADIDVLQSLVDKSLVRHTNERFWMLETIRQYARERLAKSGVEGEARRRHAEHFLAFAEHARGPTRDFSRDYFARIEGEHDNMRLALEWARDLDDGETLLRLAAALADYWGMSGFYREARVWQTLALERGSTPLEARKDVLWDAIGLALDQEDLGRAETLIEEFRDLVERTGDARRLGYALGSSAVLAAKRGNFHAARAGFARARELATERGDLLRAGSMTVSLAAVSMASGDFRSGLEYGLDAVERFRELGSERGLAIALLSCGWNALGLGDDARAEGSCREAISLAREMSAVPLIAEAALVLGLVLVARQEEERGARLLAAAAAIRDELEITLNDAQEKKMHEAAIAAAKAALGEEAFAAAWARGEAMTPEDIVSSCSEPTPGESA
jgi:predicted ATPase/class 3 adenylate cyclase